jgi:putative aldouronate transport system substrate-binding protein
MNPRGRRLTRRQFLTAVGAAGAGSMVAACGPTPPAAAPAAPTAVAAQPATAEPTVAPTQPATAEPTAAAAQPAACKLDWNQRLPAAIKKYDPVVEVAFPFPAWAQFPKGSDYTNNPFYNWTVENMGLKYTVHWQADGEVRDQKLQADIAAGTLPDFFPLSDPLLSQLIDAGALQDIREIWDKTASDLVKQGSNYPAGKNWDHCRRGEAMYAIDPGITAKVFCGISWIRQDLLDKAGLPMPKTIEDWDKTLHVFKEQKLVEFGLAAQKSLLGWGHSLDKIFGAYGVMPTFWRDYGDGKLRYDSVSPGIKDVLALLNGWYKDGLLAPDFYTYDWSKGFDQLDEGKVAIVEGPMFIVSRIVGAEQKIPGAKMSYMPLPAGPTGKPGRQWTSPVFQAWAYRQGVDPIKVEATINHLNWERAFHVHGPDDEYQCYGPLDDMGSDGLFMQGYDWDWDEKCQIKKLEFSTGDGFMDVGFKHCTYPGYQRDADLNRQKLRKMDQSALNTPQQYLLRDQGLARQEEAYAQLWNEEQYEIEDGWLGINTEQMNQLLPDLRTMEDDYLMGILVGNRPLSDFDKFVEEWHSKGGDKVTADVNAWYAAQKK